MVQSLTVGTGVDSHVEVVKFLLAAPTSWLPSALLRHGPEHMTALVDGLKRWLSQNAFASVTEIRGRLDGMHVERADMFLRTHYQRALSDYALHYSPVGPAGDAPVQRTARAR
jgi:dihydroorotate dehydrogenase (fumarate)